MTNDPDNRVQRLVSIDAARGLIIVLMALDHSRDFFGDLRINCEDPATTTWAFFATRWVTHFCAPGFVLLAGVSAFLSGRRRSGKELSQRLLSRGLWLLFLEFTVVYMGIALSVGILPFMFLVIAAIGASMVLLSFVCRFSPQVVFRLGLLIVFGHNLLDGIAFANLGVLSWLWMILHAGPGYIPELNLEVGYCVLPWFGVMCLGFGGAHVFELERERRQKILFLAGSLCLLGFLLIRAVNGYGNSRPWTLQPVFGGTTNIGEGDSGIATPETVDEDETQEKEPTKVNDQRTSYSRTLISFLAANKYPPSLAYLLMTLGPILLVLSFFDGLKDENLILRCLRTYGRVPLFFYVFHFYVLHIASIATYWFVVGQPISPFQAIYSGMGFPVGYGFQSLWQVYVAWSVLVLIMYPLCAVYFRRCKSSENRVWSYF